MAGKFYWRHVSNKITAFTHYLKKPKNVFITIISAFILSFGLVYTNCGNQMSDGADDSSFMSTLFSNRGEPVLDDVSVEENREVDVKPLCKDLESCAERFLEEVRRYMPDSKDKTKITSNKLGISTARLVTSSSNTTAINAGEVYLLCEGTGLTTQPMNDVWTFDGSLWNNILPNNTTPPPTQYQTRWGCEAVYFNGMLWMIAGPGISTFISPGIWNSSDGITWNQVASSIPSDPMFFFRSYFSLTVYNGEMWILGGTINPGTIVNEVWHSPDGINWIQEPSPPWTPRESARAVTYNNKIYMFGGWNASGVLNEVWSYNGATWVSEPTPWVGQGRAELGAVVFNNKVYLTGGFPFNANDFYSFNGIAWTQEPAPPIRSQHASFALNNKIWIVAGIDNTAVSLNEVWSFDTTANVWTQEPNSSMLPSRYLEAVVKPMPDLVVDSISAPSTIPVGATTDNPNYPLMGFPINLAPPVPVSVTIKNVGIADAVIPANMSIKLMIHCPDYTQCGWPNFGQNNFNFNGFKHIPIGTAMVLPPGGTYTIQTDSFFPFHPYSPPYSGTTTYTGPMWLWAAVDTIDGFFQNGNLVDESDEINNFQSSPVLPITVVP